MGRLFAAVCLALGVACRGGVSEPAATPVTSPVPVSGLPTPTAAPTRGTTPSSTRTPADEQGLSFAFPDEVQGGTIRDYRVRTISQITVEGENVPADLAAGSLVWDISLDIVLDPPARHAVIHGLQASSSLPSGMQQVELIQIGDTVWIKMGDVWSQVTQPPATFDQLLYFKEEFRNVPQWERVGTETVNGFSTTHYRYKFSSSELTTLSTSMFTAGMLGGGREFTDVVVESVTNDAYVTDDGMIVRSISQWVVKARLDAQPVTLTLESRYDVEGVNLGITIVPPQVETPAADVPLPEGATHKETLFGIVTYVVSGMTVDEVVAFFQEALPANGFTVGMSTVQPGEGGVIEARKDGKSYFITIDREAGEVTVTIMGGRS